MATIDEQLFHGGMRGLLFGFVGGSIAGAFYAFDVALEARVPWTALLVHAYTAACLAGALPMAVIEAARARRAGAVFRVLGLVVTGALAGAFGAARISTLPDTPYPGPLLAVGTLMIAALGFSTYAQPKTSHFMKRVATSLVPFLLLLPLLGADQLITDAGVLGLRNLTVHAERFGLVELGAIAGSLAGLGVAGYVELTLLCGRALAKRRSSARSEFAANREQLAERP
jgi:hypothetical protein